MVLMKFFSWYLITINIVAFMMYGIDKEKAKRGAWRIPESTLIGVAFLGGSFGAWTGMRYFHHKTRKKKFSVGIPLILVVEYGLRPVVILEQIWGSSNRTIQVWNGRVGLRILVGG